MKLEKGEQKRYFKAGGEWCYIWTPPGFDPGKPAPVLIHHHGARGYIRDGESDWLDTPTKAAYLRAAMEGSGCVVASSHACGGLGGALIWNSVLGPFAGKVKAVAVMQAVANLSSVVREQKFKGVLLKAYEVPEDTPDDEAIERIIKYDPMPGLQALDKGTKLPRTIIYHGAKDVNIPPDTSAKMLAEALESAGGDVTLELFDDVEHNTYAMGKPMEDRLRSFFSIL